MLSAVGCLIVLCGCVEPKVRAESLARNNSYISHQASEYIAEIPGPDISERLRGVEAGGLESAEMDSVPRETRHAVIDEVLSWEKAAKRKTRDDVVLREYADAKFLAAKWLYEEKRYIEAEKMAVDAQLCYAFRDFAYDGLENRGWMELQIPSMKLKGEMMRDPELPASVFETMYENSPGYCIREGSLCVGLEYKTTGQVRLAQMANAKATPEFLAELTGHGKSNEEAVKLFKLWLADSSRSFSTKETVLLVSDEIGLLCETTLFSGFYSEQLMMFNDFVNKYWSIVKAELGNDFFNSEPVEWRYDLMGKGKNELGVIYSSVLMQEYVHFIESLWVFDLNSIALQLTSRVEKFRRARGRSPRSLAELKSFFKDKTEVRSMTGLDFDWSRRLVRFDVSRFHPSLKKLRAIGSSGLKF